jgi:hypothetical protein
MFSIIQGLLKAATNDTNEQEIRAIRGCFCSFEAWFFKIIAIEKTEILGAKYKLVFVDKCRG